MEGVHQQEGDLFERMKHLESQLRFHQRPPDIAVPWIGLDWIASLVLILQ